MDVEYRGRTAYVPSADALVIADLHIGRASASNIEAPIGMQDALVERLTARVEAAVPSVVVVAGDVLHVHGSVPSGARETLESVVSCVLDSGAELVLVRGNHDTYLDAVDLDSRVAVVDEHVLDDGTLVCHGHDTPEGRADRYVIGHDHPAIRVEGARYRCFLRGDAHYRGADVLVLPAFSHVAAGTLVNGLQGAMSPLIDDLGAFRPVIVGAEPYEFPPLSEFPNLL